MPPYIDCKDAWCDYPELCQSDHWVPGPDEICPHCGVAFCDGSKKTHTPVCSKNAPKPEPKCDHYFLVRKGGKCHECGEVFQRNYGRGH